MPNGQETETRESAEAPPQDFRVEGRTAHHRARLMFFAGTAFAAYLIALLALLAGVLLDRHEVPFGAWSLLAYLVGACAVLPTAELGARLYREHRKRSARG